MSFVNGFEKVAMIGRAIGTAAGATARAGKSTLKGISDFATKQRAGRISGYRGALSGKQGVGESLLNRRAIKQVDAQRAADVASRKFLPGPGGSDPTAKNFASGVAKAKDSLKNSTKADVLARADKMEAGRKARKSPFYIRHPYMTAGGVFLGARALSKGDPQQPAQPPQVVQY